MEFNSKYFTINYSRVYNSFYVRLFNYTIEILFDKITPVENIPQPPVIILPAPVPTDEQEAINVANMMNMISSKRKAIPKKKADAVINHMRLSRVGETERLLVRGDDVSNPVISNSGKTLEQSDIPTKRVTETSNLSLVQKEVYSEPTVVADRRSRKKKKED